MFGDKKRPIATIAAEIDRIIGLNIRRAREDVRLGQHEVSTLLDISVHVLARYEEGQERTPAAILLQLTRHLGCHLTDLFAGMPSMESEDEFPGSRPGSTSPPEPLADRAPAERGDYPTAADRGVSGRADAQGDAAAVAEIVKAFSDLTSPLLRERLLGLLQALA